MPNATKLLQKALKAAPNRTMAKTVLEEQICAELIKAGKSEKKAAKKVSAALLEACFAVKGNQVVYVKEGSSSEDTSRSAESASKRKVEPDSEPEADSKKKKKQKKEEAASPAAAAAASGGSSGGRALGSVKMMSAGEAAAFCKENRIAIETEDGTSDHFRPVKTFADAGFSETVLRAVKAFAKPTPIQAQTWPIMMAGRDCVGVTETGSGKTLSFFLPAMMHCAKEGVATGGKSKAKGPTVLILAPTRELAMQSDDVCRVAGKEAGLSSVCIYGGVPKHTQKQAIRDGAQVVVATPGRLLDLHQEGACDLSSVTYLVLDEADRMLDMGFEKDVRAIVSSCAPSPRRRTLMFTATWPEEIRQIASEFLDNPVRVNVGSVDLAANTRVTQTVEVIDGNKKEARLIPLLNKYHKSRTNRVLVFALYKKEAARLEEFVKRNGFNGVAIHGDMTQAARTAALQQFKDGSVPLLIATDVAARGLDIPDVEVVINYAFPLTIEDYIHRIGRTGRGGKTGISYTLFTDFDKSNAGALQNVLREAGQEVPEALLKFGSAVKKKEHKMYGAFSGSGAPMKQATKIVF